MKYTRAFGSLHVCLFLGFTCAYNPGLQPSGKQEESVIQPILDLPGLKPSETSLLPRDHSEDSGKVEEEEVHGVRGAGVRARVSRTGLEYAVTMATQILQQQMPNINIADQKGVRRLRVGSLEHVLTHIRVQRFLPPNASVTTHPQFTWRLRGLSLSLTADFAYVYRALFLTVRDHGALQASLNLNLDATVTLERHHTGHLKVNISQCSCTITNVDIDFYEGWLYNLVDTQVERYLKTQLQWQICHEAQVVVNEKANAALWSMPELLTLQDGLLLDYRLVAPPLFHAHSLDIHFAGEFRWVHGHGGYNFAARPLPDSLKAHDIVTEENHLHMVSFWVSEHTVRTLLHTLFKHGRLNAYITRNDLGDSEQFMFKTTCESFFRPCFGLVVPLAREFYPDYLIEANVFASSPPNLHISEGGISTHLRAVVEFYAARDNSTQPASFLFSINLDGIYNVSVALENERITGRLTDFRIEHISLNRTEIGQVSMTYMHIVIQLVMIGYVMPRVDTLGQRGVKLPTIDQVQYTNAELRFYEHAFYVGVNASYTGAGQP